MDKKRIHQFDFLKIAIAIIIILLHYQQVFLLRFPNFNFYYGRFYFGYFVELFFTISGFLSASIIINKIDKTFLLKKIIRIYPMVIISTTVTYLIYIIFYKCTGIMLLDWLGIDVSFWKYICNCALIFRNGIFGYNFACVNNPLWYLSVLMLLYVIFYIEHKIAELFKININYIYLFVLIVFIAGRIFNLDIPALYNNFSRGIIPFTIGCLLVYINNKLSKYHINIIAFIGLIIIMLSFFIGKSSFIDNQQNILMYAVHPLIVLYFLNSKIIKKITNFSFISELGKISFEMFLWQMSAFYLLMIINHYTNNMLPVRERWFMLMTAGIIMIWSTLVYYFIEKPLFTKLNKLIKNN